MSVYNEFVIKVDSEHRKHDIGDVLNISQDGNGGLQVDMFTDYIENRSEWQEIKAALVQAGAQLGRY